MSITVNGQSCVPPGFRFHPTEEELLNYYLRKKVACEKIDLDVIRDVDLNKLEPWDIQEKCKIGSTPQNDWYFFSHKDKKYPTGTRTNRATAAGFWKATGRDKVIYSSCKRIGMRKTLVFYKGRAPHGQKSDWIMHEYRLDEHSDSNSLSNVVSSMGETSTQEDGWVVCRVFKKKNHHKSLDSPNNNRSPMIGSDAKTQLLLHSTSDGALDQILQYMGRSCKQETQAIIRPNKNSGGSSSNNNVVGNHLRYLHPMETLLSASLNERYMKLPALESPTTIPSLSTNFPTAPPHVNHLCSGGGDNQEISYQTQSNPELPAYHEQGLSDWAALDRLVASHLNGQSEASKQLACFDDPPFVFCPSNSGAGSDGDLWSLTSSASDHISHVSHDSI